MFNVDLNQSLQIFVILLISVTFHELAHGLTATALGDQTPRRNGQLTLNPMAHMDQFAILFMFLASLAGFLFAYGRTFINPQSLRFGPQRGGAIVAAAGPLTNLAIALVIGLILGINAAHGCPASPLGLQRTFNVTSFLYLAMEANVILFLFNLIPIPPLDGFSIVSGFLTPRQLYAISPLVQYSPYIFLAFLFINIDTNVFSTHVVTPVMDRITAWFQILCL
jgi:Zn-dependent protease